MTTDPKLASAPSEAAKPSRLDSIISSLSRFGNEFKSLSTIVPLVSSLAFEGWNYWKKISTEAVPYRVILAIPSSDQKDPQSLFLRYMVENPGPSDLDDVRIVLKFKSTKELKFLTVDGGKLISNEPVAHELFQTIEVTKNTEHPTLKANGRFGVEFMIPNRDCLPTAAEVQVDGEVSRFNLEVPQLTDTTLFSEQPPLTRPFFSPYRISAVVFGFMGILSVFAGLRSKRKSEMRIAAAIENGKAQIFNDAQQKACESLSKSKIVNVSAEDLIAEIQKPPA